MQLLGVDEPGDAVDERSAEREVAGGRARLDHRLALPRGGLALVVRERCRQRAHQHAAPPARPEREVDTEGDAVVGGVGQQREEGRTCAFVDALGGDEEEVDVARVVQLPAAELAQRDDRDPVRACLLEAAVGDGRDLLDDVLVVAAVEVASRDPQHRPATEPPEAGAGAVRVDVRASSVPRASRSRAETSASASTSSGWRTSRSLAAVENPSNRDATGRISG